MYGMQSCLFSIWSMLSLLDGELRNLVKQSQKASFLLIHAIMCYFIINETKYITEEHNNLIWIIKYDVLCHFFPSINCLKIINCVFVLDTQGLCKFDTNSQSIFIRFRVKMISPPRDLSIFFTWSPTFDAICQIFVPICLYTCI
jgi:hypothetical protein